MTLKLNTELCQRIRQHALRHYNAGGWDYLVECYSDGDILLLVAECQSYEDAIAKLGRIVAIQDERRREVQSEVF